MQDQLNIVTMGYYLDPKQKKTIYTGKLPTNKRRKENLFGFFSNQTDTQKENEKKENKTSMDDTVAKCEHRLTK